VDTMTLWPLMASLNCWPTQIIFCATERSSVN
jgi:hypothetical protein